MHMSISECTADSILEARHPDLVTRKDHMLNLLCIHFVTDNIVDLGNHQLNVIAYNLCDILLSQT